MINIYFEKSYDREDFVLPGSEGAIDADTDEDDGSEDAEAEDDDDDADDEA